MPREMKDSGIEWIGEIPNNWILKPLKYICNLKTGSTPKNKEGITDYGDYPWITPSDLTDKYAIDKSAQYISAVTIKKNNYHLYPKNSVLLVCIASVGKVGIITKSSYSNQQITALKPRDNINPKFLLYCMLAGSSQLKFDASSNVVPIVNTNYLANFSIPYTFFRTQQTITDFLDHKCNEIDALHADIEKQIATLEEYKKSIITEAVTKGLNPGVEMKDSGIEWCPSIPKHWIKTNPKFLFSLRNQKALPGEQQLTASQKYGIIAQDEFMKIENQQLVTVTKDFSILKHVEPNDFVISMRSFQGGLEYSKLRGCISSAYVMLIPNSKKVYPPFYKWFFKSTKYINALQSTTNLVRDGQAMRYANFIQIPLFIIPISEQQEIADYLDQKTTEIDSIISAKKQQLDVLENYKKSLIYEYVTGKKEVPSYANAE